MSSLNQKIDFYVKKLPGYRIYKKLRSLRILSQTELELLADPWYHDFQSLGFNTPFNRDYIIYRQNQECKQGPLFDLINKAVQLCKTKTNFVKGVELFCADGFYTNFAIKCGADSLYGIDINKHEISKAYLMSRLLGSSKKVKFEQSDVFSLSGEYDFCICAGGLYHITNPAKLLSLLSEKIKIALVIQTVYSMKNNSENYFETPAPGWDWGCRFSYKYLLQMVQDAGWTIIEEAKNELKANNRLEDRGSAYLLCVPSEKPSQN